jgi:hypothetical protein
MSRQGNARILHGHAHRKDYFWPFDIKLNQNKTLIYRLTESTPAPKVFEDIREYIDRHSTQRPRQHVMASFANSLKEFNELYRELAK